MGTNTDFTGAIRITPCVEEPLATRLKQFMDIRHMKRNVKTLHTLFPDLEDRKPMSLFGDGDFGEEGAFFIPVETPDLNRRLHEAGPYPEGLDNKFSMNKPPNPCPSLYCDLVLLNDRTMAAPIWDGMRMRSPTISRTGSSSLPGGYLNEAITWTARCSLWSRAACPTIRSRWTGPR